MSEEEVGTPKRTWQDVANEVAHESDSRRLSTLISELNTLLLAEERQKVIQRFGERKAGRRKSAA
jgi:hypothetical protein